jgi:hypothetical protein
MGKPIVAKGYRLSFYVVKFFGVSNHNRYTFNTTREDTASVNDDDDDDDELNP